MSIPQKVFSLLSCFTLVFTTIPLGAPPAVAQEQYAPMSADDLDAMVAPIALYPDELIAQVLGAASYPDQIVEANDWLQANPGLQGKELMLAADQQSWDDAVKAITLFPSVVKLLAENLAWTSALGEAAVTQQDDVMAAIQRMRAKAYQAGNLKTTKEIKVVQQSPDVIVIQSANPQVVYVPTYNPTVVYGAPVVVPGYSSADLAATAIVSFGVGIAVGALINNSCCGWGYGWGMHWHGGGIYYHSRVYYGNPYWHGRPPGYYPGYRPPYYPPPGGHPPYPPPPGGRPPYPPPPGGKPPYPPGGHPPAPPPGGGRPPVPPPGGGKPPSPPTGGRPPSGGNPPGRPPGGGGGTRPTPPGEGGGGGTRPPGGGPSGPGVPGAPGGARPAPQPRPAPAAPMPGQKDLRGYGSAGGGKPNSFTPTPSDRSASMRGNQSLGNTPRPAPSAPKAAPKPAPAPRSAPAPRKR